MQPWFIPMFYLSGAVLGGLGLPRIEQAYLDPDPDARLSVAAWVKATGVTNVGAPIALDASQSGCRQKACPSSPQIGNSPAETALGSRLPAR
jgi:hypothetical protein